MKEKVEPKPKIPMRILGVDPGCNITGFGVVQTGLRPTTIDYGCIRLPSTFHLNQRYHLLFTSLKSLIESFQPRFLSIETQYVHKNAQTAMKLAMARSAIIIAALDAGIDVFEYTPSQVKKAVCGSGRASKQQVQNMVMFLLSLKSRPQPEDAADALAAALCHYNRVKEVER